MFPLIEELGVCKDGIVRFEMNRSFEERVLIGKAT